MEVLNFLLGIVFLAIAGFVYFIPSIVGRKKKNADAIKVLNLLTGWTVIGWVVALVWSMTED